MKAWPIAALGVGSVLGIVAVGTVRTKPVIRVVAIPGQPLPVAVAMSRGMFDRQGIRVRIRVVPSSDELRAALAAGQADIAHAAVDNAVAMAESGKDVVIVLGGERSLNELIAQPAIRSIPELRGHTLLVDAPDTAFALQLIDILLAHGLRPNRDYRLEPAGTTPQRFAAMRDNPNDAATMLGPPWSILAKRQGFVSLGSTPKLIGPYQSAGAFALRSWAREHPDTLERYLAAYIEAQRWLLAPGHEPQVIGLLEEHLRLSPSMAVEMYALISAKNHALYEPDARLDVAAFRNVLKLRAEVEGQWGGRAPSVYKYYDPAYYQRALSMLERPK